MELACTWDAQSAKRQAAADHDDDDGDGDDDDPYHFVSKRRPADTDAPAASALRRQIRLRPSRAFNLQHCHRIVAPLARQPQLQLRLQRGGGGGFDAGDVI